MTLSAASVTNTGGSPITKWQYAYKSKPSGGSYSNYGSWNNVTGTSTTMPNTTVSNLTNGTEYTFKVRAVNSNGDGADSPESDAVTPATTPPAPSKPTVTGGDAQVTLSAASVANTGGSPITKWQYAYKSKPSGGSYGNYGSWNNVTGTSTTMPNTTVSSLTNGTEYTFKVRAVNSIGDGADSPESDAVTPATTPPAPSKPTVTGGDAQVTLSAASVANTGGSPITKWQYAYKSKPSGGSYGNYGSWNNVTGTSTTMPNTTVSNLTNGTEYTFKVRAVNSNGDGADSPESDAVTPATTPPAPSKPTVTGGDAQVTLSAASVANTGGSPITKWQYAYKSKPSGGSYGNYGSWNNVTGTSTTMPNTTVSSLTNGTEYTFKVRAVNSNGDGADSPESDAVTPATTPPAPSKPTVTGGDAQVTLSAASVANTGGSPITKWQYAYKSKPSGGSYGNYGSWNNVTGTSTTMPNTTVSNLTNGTEYTFKVRAVNSNGDGADSPESDAVTPATTPPAPSKPTVTGGDAQVTLSAASVANTGGSPITKWQYAYKSKPSGGSYGNYGSWNNVTGTSTTMPNTTVSNLTNGTEYTFKVRAVNSNGDGADSPESDAVTLAVTATLTTPANASQSVTAGAGDAKLTASNVTHHSATLTIGNHNGDWYYKTTAPTIGICSASAVNTLSVDLADLAGNTSYTFKAYSNSGCTTELAAAAAFLTKPAKPAKPTVTAGAGNGTLTLASSVTGGTGALSKWEYSTDDGTTWTTINVTSTTLSHVVTGLTDGTDYTFKVRAVNATGTGPTSDASDPATPRGKATLTVSSVTHHSATLTIGNHTGDWYYKATTPTSGVCSATAVATASLDLADLAGNTSYTFKAYSNSTCATELATASAFLTKPAKPSKPTVTAGAGRDTLTLSASVTGDGTLTKWQYTTDDGANWSDINVTATTLNHTVTDLTGWTDYTFKVRAVNATGTGPASDASDPATSSAVDSPKAGRGFPQAGRRDPPQGGWSSHYRHHHGNHDATGCNCSRSSSQQPAGRRGHRFPAVLAEPGTGVESRTSAMGGSPLRSQLRSSPPPARLVLGRRCSRH